MVTLRKVPVRDGRPLLEYFEKNLCLLLMLFDLINAATQFDSTVKGILLPVVPVTSFHYFCFKLNLCLNIPSVTLKWSTEGLFYAFIDFSTHKLGRCTFSESYLINSQHVEIINFHFLI